MLRGTDGRDRWYGKPKPNSDGRTDRDDKNRSDVSVPKFGTSRSAKNAEIQIIRKIEDVPSDISEPLPPNLSMAVWEEGRAVKFLPVQPQSLVSTARCYNWMPTMRISVILSMRPISRAE